MNFEKEFKEGFVLKCCEAILRRFYVDNYQNIEKKDFEIDVGWMSSGIRIERLTADVSSWMHKIYSEYRGMSNDDIKNEVVKTLEKELGKNNFKFESTDNNIHNNSNYIFSMTYDIFMKYMYKSN